MQALFRVVRAAPLALSLVGAIGCGDETPSGTPREPGQSPAETSLPEAGLDEGAAAPSNGAARIRYRSDVTPVTSLTQALPGTFIPPFVDCRPPQGSDIATRADGLVCTNVAISGCTEPSKYFPDYADCDVVRRQRPYWAAPPANPSRPDDPRLADPSFLRESDWAKEQIEASGCACCHDGRIVAASQWDISLGPLWIDSLSSAGLALFAGFADSSVLGAYAPADNFGFDRAQTGIPTTDTARMRAFVLGELSRRGLDEAWARGVPPFGGPIYANSVKPPELCGAGQGVEPDGRVRFDGSQARYVYVLAEGSKNPGVPPNLDLPQGTLFRLDVLASAPPLESGAVRFGETPDGSFQAYPEATPAAPLNAGTRYQLVVLQDVGLPAVNCIFEFGKPVAMRPSAPGPTASADAGAGSGSSSGAQDAGADASGSSAPDGASCTLSGGDADGFGAPCDDTVQHTDCPCRANYCSKSPFDSQGYCSITGCKEDPSLCPAGYRCLDISQFAPGQPSVCVKQ